MPPPPARRATAPGGPTGTWSCSELRAPPVSSSYDIGSINASADGVHIHTVLRLAKDEVGRLKISNMTCNASIARMHAGFSGTLRYPRPRRGGRVPLPGTGLALPAPSSPRASPPRPGRALFEAQGVGGQGWRLLQSCCVLQEGLRVPEHLHCHGDALPRQPAGRDRAGMGHGSDVGPSLVPQQEGLPPGKVQEGPQPHQEPWPCRRGSPHPSHVPFRSARPWSTPAWCC